MMKKYRVITKAGDRVVRANHVKYDDLLIQFFNQNKDVIATFMIAQVVGVVDEAD